jgi:Beta-ketoacyl synthase, N-terminal domain
MKGPAHRAWIDGVALWSPTLPGWAASRAALAQAGPLPPVAQQRPAPTLLAANERRRAPDAVLLALQVAQQAAADAGHPIQQLPSVFTSAHGDLAITDALCRTLADNPALLSPTRFHHSVHNAASGYWAIAAGCQAGSTALAALQHSFAAGLLEALCLCATDAQPTLLVACDTEAVGPLTSTNSSRGLLALALVLSPRPGPCSRWTMSWQLGPVGTPKAAQSPAAQTLAHNATAPGLLLLETLARGRAETHNAQLSDRVALQLCIEPVQA